ncbi:fimbrial protein [Escherichia coli]|uniref:fimbrial protein n=1 Tax=Escherichia coli TaxID=562 RepID=UPI0010F31BF4|nr:fimbrial protein [Escherichia coli]GDM19299.1 fimbrial adapter PapK precursor [Escherichia coli]
MRRLLLARNIFRLTGCLPLLLTLPVCAVDVDFKGVLHDYPCKIDSGKTDHTVQFLDRPAKDFHVSPGKGPAEKFRITLKCNVSPVWKTVKLKFKSEKTEPGMKEKSAYFLPVTGPNTGKLAVGILDTDGVSLLKLGGAHNNNSGSLISGDTVLNFKAFIQATPEAILRKSVIPGTYESTVTFELSYE